MGLFDFITKKQERPRNNLPSNISFSTTLQAPPHAIPDDIPMQLPKFQDSQVSHDNLVLPTFGKEPEKLKDPFMQNIVQPYSDSLSISPISKPQSAQINMNNFTKQMTTDPENPFEQEKYESMLNSHSYSYEKQNDGSNPSVSFVEGEEDHAKLRAEFTLDAPIFINVNDFAVILENITEIKNQNASSNNNFARITNLLKDKEIQFNAYDKLLEDIQKKLIYVDKTLFEN